MTQSNVSNIVITNRQSIKINGVDGVTMLNETDATVLVGGDNLKISGEDLKADKLSVETGELVINGKINSLKFEEKREKQGFFKKIFK